MGKLGDWLQKLAALFCFGGAVYGLIETLWRGGTHWTMVVLGGALFILLGGINELLPWSMPIQWQALLGTLAVTAAEFLAGCVVNLWLGWNVWDYSDQPFNLLGQICLSYTLLWIPLSAAAIVLDDFLRCLLFGEEWPRYTLR